MLRLVTDIFNFGRMFRSFQRGIALRFGEAEVPLQHP